MLVILMDNQILASQQVCQGCLLADQSGQPRWRGGQLSCGHLVRPSINNQPSQYECQMGFRIANIQ
ncbi:conserved hypothetical protein [Planktothrix sp. PCC 11201]|uniref:hypothetical protein n=1 Tax=Planktothrix sp. PCC 11201 TaxID=1729650 RepID=UPI0009221D94|nr:hypothetical protein [Planktothrix sp. PCC 11201]SKB11670.1 conserved hypothetical protein [Planktothrix sp. PCC 11201]